MSAIQKLTEQEISRNTHVSNRKDPAMEYIERLTRDYFKVLDENRILLQKIGRLEFEMDMHNIKNDFV